MADIRFIHKDGRVIPIRAPGAAGKALKVYHAVAGAAGVHAAATGLKKPAGGATTTPIKPNKLMKFSSMGLSIGEGLLTGAALGHGVKANVAAHAVGFGMDAGAVGLAAGAYVGKGRTKDRAKAIVKQEAINQALGWGTFAATILARPAGRKAAVEIAKSVPGYAAKILKLGRKALRVV